MSVINDSILGSIRKLLGPEDDYTHFDPDIAIHINSAINRLYQLGLESAQGFRIEDGSETWEDLVGDDSDAMDMCKTLIYYKTKMGFDPPTSSIASEAIKSEIDKQEWLISVWVDKLRTT